MSTPPLQSTLSELVGGRPLSEAGADAAFEEVLAGRADAGQIGAMLALIAARGPTIDELVGAARAMRRHATRVEAPAAGRFAGATMIDTCGTGGGPKLFNVSTIGAIVTAAAGDARVMVCKHGNVSRTGRGSAELMQALGVRIDAPPAVQTWCLGEVGVCFSLASAHHPAVRHASAVRKALGFPTIFNLIGPLANPGGALRQAMGTWSHDNARLLAGALARLGAERAIVFCSRDGFDELTTTDVNMVHEVTGGTLKSFDLDARDIGLPRCSPDDLRASSLEHAVQIATDVLAGRPGPCRDMVILNAGAALWVAGAAADIREGASMAGRALDDGRAEQTLRVLVRMSGQA